MDFFVDFIVILNYFPEICEGIKILNPPDCRLVMHKANNRP